MMAKIKQGGGFQGVLKYVLDEGSVNDKIVTLLDYKGVAVDVDEYGSFSASAESLAMDFRLQSDMNPNVTKPVKHIMLSYSPEDIAVLTEGKMIADARKYLEEMGYGNTQYFVVAHSEKNNPHMHIIANMVDNEGRRIKDFQEYKCSCEICRKITEKNKYAWGAHRSWSQVQDFRSDREKAKYLLSRTILVELSQAASMEDLIKRLELKHCISVRISYNENRVPSGISFSIPMEDRHGDLTYFSFAGNQVGRNFTARSIYYACVLKKNFPSVVDQATAVSVVCQAYRKRLSEPQQKELGKLDKALSELGDYQPEMRKQIAHAFDAADFRTALTLLKAAPLIDAMNILLPAIKSIGKYPQYRELYRALQAYRSSSKHTPYIKANLPTAINLFKPINNVHGQSWSGKAKKSKEQLREENKLYLGSPENSMEEHAFNENPYAESGNRVKLRR